jgi:hypothetical protein
MKRSEMIERLTCFLSEEQGYREDRSYAEGIVKFLERQGMQPPKIEKWRELSGTILGEGLAIKTFEHEWEPEENEE